MLGDRNPGGLAYPFLGKTKLQVEVPRDSHIPTIDVVQPSATVVFLTLDGGVN